MVAVSNDYGILKKSLNDSHWRIINEYLIHEIWYELDKGGLIGLKYLDGISHHIDLAIQQIFNRDSFCNNLKKKIILNQSQESSIWYTISR